MILAAKLNLANHTVIKEDGKYFISTEIGLVNLGSKTAVMMPGEICQDLVCGGNSLTAEGSVSGKAFDGKTVREIFGDDVAELVASNSEDKSKSWDERKLHTITELATADVRVKMLIMADKLSNIRSIAYDYAIKGDDLWIRFNAPKEKQTWYYDGILDALYDLQDIPQCEKAYWEITGLFKDVFVKYYLDKKKD